MGSPRSALRPYSPDGKSDPSSLKSLPTSPISQRCAEHLALLVLVLLVLWFCQEIVFSDQVPFFRDLGNYFYPIGFAVYESFRAGELPLWNRHMATGFPLVAAFQSGAFYPPHLLFLAAPFFLAVRALFVFHFTVAVTGGYKLCRHWESPPYVAMVGALLFTLGGTLVSLTNVLNHFQAAVWLPWLVLFWERLLFLASWRNFVAFTFLAATQLLAGSPEIFGLSLLIVFVDTFRICRVGRAASLRMAVVLFVGANFLVLLLTMVQLLPTFELILESRRQQPIPTVEVLQWSLKPISLLNVFLLDKEIELSIAGGARFLFARTAPFLLTHYLGAISVVGFGCWLWCGSVREKITVGSAVAASLLIALGIHTPVYPFVLQHLPFLGVFRFPEKVFFFTYAMLLYTVVQGLKEALSHDPRSARQSVIVCAAVALLWSAVYISCRFNYSVVAGLIAAYTELPLAIHHKAVAAVMSSLERQLILACALALLFALKHTRLIRPSLFSGLLVVLVFTDLAWAHRGFLFPLRTDFVSGTGRILQLPAPDASRLFYYPAEHNLHPSSLMARGRPIFKQATALSFQNLLPNAGVLYGFDYMQEIDALARRPYSEFIGFANQLEPKRQIRLLRTFNVEYIVSFRPLTIEGIKLVKEFPEYFSWLYRVERRLPRAYLVHRGVLEKDPRRTLQLLSGPGFDPETEVVLDREFPLQPAVSSNGTGRIVRYEDRAVTIATSSDHDSILVLADSYYPGWRAYVDGTEREIFRANYFFRAVIIPAGEHSVSFRYEPRSFTVGLVISILTLAGLAMTTVVVYRSSSRKRAIGTVVPGILRPEEHRPDRWPASV